ncbi:hypothetical protein JW921_06795 [Candidatus Fermentibacterales bacterium]|nr:hypothetical protein [Candidatus Fermentibacterales bacterium]
MLVALHATLEPGALILLPDRTAGADPQASRRLDTFGDTPERRTIPDGRVFEVVKDFPAEDGISGVLADHALDAHWKVYPDEHTWQLTCRFSRGRSGRSPWRLSDEDRRG